MPLHDLDNDLRMCARAATARLGAVMDDMTAADRAAVHKFLKQWREDLGIEARPSKNCVNCSSENLSRTSAELASNRQFVCNECGYLQD